MNTQDHTILELKVIDLEKKNLELEAALKDVSETANNWLFGWDGDCGLTSEIENIVDTALLKSNVN